MSLSPDQERDIIDNVMESEMSMMLRKHIAAFLRDHCSDMFNDATMMSSISYALIRVLGGMTGTAFSRGGSEQQRSVAMESQLRHVMEAMRCCAYESAGIKMKEPN